MSHYYYSYTRVSCAGHKRGVQGSSILPCTTAQSTASTARLSLEGHDNTIHCAPALVKSRAKIALPKPICMPKLCVICLPAFGHDTRYSGADRQASPVRATGGMLLHSICRPPAPPAPPLAFLLLCLSSTPASWSGLQDAVAVSSPLYGALHRRRPISCTGFPRPTASG